MKSKKYPKILILIIAIFMMFFAIMITWNNEDSHINLIFDTILIGLSINVISSILLIYFLEERDKKREEKEKKEKQKIVYDKLIFIIRKFNRFMTDMYKATMKEKIKDNDEMLENLYCNINQFYRQINKIDFYKNSNVLKRNYDIIRNPIYFNWYEIYLASMQELFTKTRDLVNNYAFLLNSDLLNNLKFIDNSSLYIFQIKNPLSNDLNEIAILEVKGKEEKWEKVIFAMSNLKNILQSISKIMVLINKETETNNFRIEANDFNAQNMSPKIGSGLL